MNLLEPTSTSASEDDSEIDDCDGRRLGYDCDGRRLGYGFFASGIGGCMAVAEPVRIIIKFSGLGGVLRLLERVSGVTLEADE